MVRPADKDRDKKPKMVIYDQDVRFTNDFTKIVEHAKMTTNPLPKGSSNLNGSCERVIETIKQECLAKFIVLGKRHTDYLISEFTAYYNTRTCHLRRGSLPPIWDVPEEVVKPTMDQIQVNSYAGGLVTSFERKAA